MDNCIRGEGTGEADWWLWDDDTVSTDWLWICQGHHNHEHHNCLKLYLLHVASNRSILYAPALITNGQKWKDIVQHGRSKSEKSSGGIISTHDQASFIKKPTG